MKKVSKGGLIFVGMDVHKETIVISVAEEGREAAWDVGKVAHEEKELLRVLKKLGKPEQLRVVYEAGFSGYALWWTLNHAGIMCEIAAPSRIPEMPGKAVKTDRVDARNLAVMHRGGHLRMVVAPDPAFEAVRDLWRARHAAVKARHRHRQELLKFLDRQGRKFPGKTHWTKGHRAWLSSQKFENSAHTQVMRHYLDMVEQSEKTVTTLAQALEVEARDFKQRELVEALSALKSVDKLMALGLVAELGDLRRFKTPGHLASYLGLTPREYSSGNKQRRGGITRQGNGFVRQMLIEAAHNYRNGARHEGAVKLRREGLDPEVVAIAKEAGNRLQDKYWRLIQKQGKHRLNAVCAVARELCGPIWAIAQVVYRKQEMETAKGR